MASPRIDELSSTLVHTDGKNSYNLRIIEYKNREGVTCRKFGISEFWWCDRPNRLYPSRKHHVFLPLSVWPKLVALGDQIEQFAHGFREEGPAQSNDETIELVDATEQSGNGPDAEDDLLKALMNAKPVLQSNEPGGKRKRRRPSQKALSRRKRHENGRGRERPNRMPEPVASPVTRPATSAPCQQQQSQ